MTFSRVPSTIPLFALLAAAACSDNAIAQAGAADSDVVATEGQDGGADARAADCRTTGTKTECTYKRVDGLALDLDVYAAPQQGIRPALVWIHGGALVMGHRNWLEQAQLAKYQRKGYVVISIDYRLAPETKLEKIHEDIADAWKFVRANAARFKVDPDRIGLVGHSAGGYLTLTSGFRLDPRPKALVSFYGYGDVTGEWYTTASKHYLEDGPISESWAHSGILARPLPHTPFPGTNDDKRWDFYVWCRQNGAWPKKVGDHDPATEGAWFRKYEAIHNVDRNYPPTILLHGGKDTDVPVEQSRAMFAKLQASGVDAKLVENPQWEHGFDGELGDPSVVTAFDDVLAFLGRHLRP